MHNLIKPALILLVIIGVFLGLAFSGILPSAINPFKKKEMEIIETALKVEDIKAIAQLFTQQYVNEFIVKKVHKTKGFFYGYSSDELIIIAKGTCFAGTDLSELKQEDIKILDSVSVEITIPKAKILQSIINPSGFDIFVSEGYWENNFKAVQKVKLEAVKTLEKMAKNTSILKKADAKSVEIMEKFMRSVGYSNVNVKLK